MQKAAYALSLIAPAMLVLFCNHSLQPEQVQVFTQPGQMKLIPTGTFSMGADDTVNNFNALPVHQVTLDSFYMDSVEVTQELYWDCMKKNPAYYAGDQLLPVTNVSWFDAVLFCNERSKLEHFSLDTVYSYSAASFRETETGVMSCSTLTDLSYDLSRTGYRLPTEAEWEYACRAGTTTEFYWGSEDHQDTVDMYAWFVYNAVRRPHPVALKLPNSWGLYDMSGNVKEWCNDWYSGGYSPDPVNKPIGPMAGTERVMRGGSYMGDASTGYTIRSASRSSKLPEEYAPTLGFRCVLMNSK